MSLMPPSYMCLECGKFHDLICPNKRPSLELKYPPFKGGLPTTAPKIVCLCGSTKFKDLFIRHQERLTLQGCIVLSVGLFGHKVYESSEEEIDLVQKRNS
jgi:hypothetical protein